jgi:putative DNA primase/helicase
VGDCAWQEREAIQSCVKLFKGWMEQMRARGLESSDTKILKSIASYISRFADSRFSSIKGTGPDERVKDRSGYWEDIACPGGEVWRIFLLTSDALEEAAKGYNIHHISAALKAAGALSKTSGDGKHLAVYTRTPHRTREWLYDIDPEKLQSRLH